MITTSVQELLGAVLHCLRCHMSKNSNLYFASKVSLAELIGQYQRFFAFVIAVLIFVFLHIIKGVAEFPWDAGGYWRLSATEILFDFPKEIRGYFYPALLSPARYFSDVFPALGLAPYRIISSVIYSYFFTVLLPAFYLHVFGGKVSFLRRLIVPVLVAFLFPGVVIYTLSDLPALALMVSASACALHSVSSKSSAKRYALLAFAGVLAYGAYNTRTIFLFSAAVLTLGLGLIVYYKHSAKTKTLATIVFLLGAGVASLPQVLINLKNQSSFSPLVITTSPYNRSLFASQLLWGITIQRYETSIDKASPGAGVFYLDKAGQHLFAENNIGSAPFGLRAYLDLVVHNPVEFFGIYGRHVVNGLDLRDGSVYTVGQSWRKNVLAMMNFLVLFSGFLVVAMAISKQCASKCQKIKSAFWAFLILLPVIAIIPGAIETRFFLAFHLSIYCALAFSSEPKLVIILLRRQWVLIFSALLISALMFFSVSTVTMSAPQYDYSDLYRGMW